MTLSPIVIDAEAVRLLRAMTPEQRLTRAFDLTHAARLLLLEATRRQHPDLPEADARQRMVDVLLGR